VGKANVSTAREEILQRVRQAIVGERDSETTVPPRDYRHVGLLDRVARTDLLCERIGDYQAEVRRLPASELPTVIGQVFEKRSASRVGVPAGLPVEWLPAGLQTIEDHGLSPAELDRLDGVLTGCTLAIAETGTIVLSAGPIDGRRALSLVPDLHVCVVSEDQIVELVPEAFAALGPLVVQERRPLTFVSGPSATSDIELSRVEGVHGPRSLVVLVTVREH
jgi:L-lactate dehydrogenase complex protein LldG